MKKLTSKAYFGIFVALNCFVFLGFLIYILAGNTVKLDADLFNMTPSNSASKVYRIADQAVSGNSGKSVSILVRHKDFAEAKKAAVASYDALKESDNFENLVLYSDNSSFSSAMDFMYEWTPVLLNEEVQKSLNESGAREDFILEQTEKIFNPFSLADLSRLSEDPFLVTESVINDFMKFLQDTGTNFSPKDNVLATQFEGDWYILMTATLSSKGAKLAGKDGAVPEIYKVCSALEKDGVYFVYSGTPFHSYHSSSKANLEISIISTVSMLIVLVILILTFKSIKPVLFSMLAITLSVLTAFCSTHMVFGNIHVMTLVFGTCLIGSCIDYSIHYFIQWKFNTTLDDGAKIRSYCIKSMSLALLSTEICFLFLVFAPFMLLKQMAFFCLSGILSSFVTTICLYPSLKLPQNRVELKVPLFIENTLKKAEKLPLQKIIAVSIVAFSVLVIGIRFKSFGINNNIARLYQMQGRLKDDTILASRVMNYTYSNWLILSCDSEEELFELDEEIGSELGDGYISTTKFIPSGKKQLESFDSYKKLLPYLSDQAEMTGLDLADVKAFKSKLKDFETRRLNPDSEIPGFMRNFVDMLYLGKVDDKYCSIILPTNAKTAEKIVEIAQNNPNVFYENKVQDINTQLDKLSKMIFVLLLIAVVILFVVLLFFYSFKNVLKIVVTPLIGLLFICAVFTLLGRKIDFFCVTGMILVFGLGLDYIIYKVTNAANAEEDFSIILSFVTTVLSFGTLGLSSFVPVQTMGLAIFVGLLASFFCVIFNKE